MKDKYLAQISDLSDKEVINYNVWISQRLLPCILKNNKKFN